LFVQVLVLVALLLDFRSVRHRVRTFRAEHVHIMKLNDFSESEELVGSAALHSRGSCHL